MSFVQEIQRNQLKSVLLTFFFFVFIVALIWVLTAVAGWGAFGTVLAVFLAIIFTIGSYYWSDQIVLR